MGLINAILLTAMPALLVALACRLRWKKAMRRHVSPWANWLTGITFGTLFLWAVGISFSSVIANGLAIFVACLCLALFLHAHPNVRLRRRLIGTAWGLVLLPLPLLWWNETRYLPDFFPSQQISLRNGDSCRIKDDGASVFGPPRIMLSVFRPLPVLGILERRIATVSMSPEKESHQVLSDAELCEAALGKIDHDAASS